MCQNLVIYCVKIDINIGFIETFIVSFSLRLLCQKPSVFVFSISISEEETVPFRRVHGESRI